METYFFPPNTALLWSHELAVILVSFFLSCFLVILEAQLRAKQEQDKTSSFTI